MEFGKTDGERKSKPRPALPAHARSMGSREARADRFQGFRAHADAVIPDGEDYVARIAAYAERHAAVRGEFHRVGEKIKQDLTHRAGVDETFRKRALDVDG